MKLKFIKEEKLVTAILETSLTGEDLAVAPEEALSIVDEKEKTLFLVTQGEPSISKWGISFPNSNKNLSFSCQYNSISEMEMKILTYAVEKHGKALEAKIKAFAKELNKVAPKVETLGEENPNV